MSKILFIVILLGVLLFFIIRKFSTLGNTSNNYVSNSTVVDLALPFNFTQKIFQKTLYTVGIGFILLIMILVLTAKFKLALILLPISLYLIGQFFVFNNHVKAIKKQKLQYHTVNNELLVYNNNQLIQKINLVTDSVIVKEVKSVQKNNGIFFGYYHISKGTFVVHIPFILELNPQTKPFFDKLQLFNREIETKLFPII